jgi:hypothetical protein
VHDHVDATTGAARLPGEFLGPGERGDGARGGARGGVVAGQRHVDFHRRSGGGAPVVGNRTHLLGGTHGCRQGQAKDPRGLPVTC